MSLVLTRLCLFVFLLISHVGSSETERSNNLDGKTIRSISFKGLGRTKEYVALREVRFAKGDLFSAVKYEEGLQRLRNLQIFSKVTGTVLPSENEDLDITITLDERWTTLPIFRALNGGGSASYIGGLFDINSFGRYLELGGQYENLNGNHSGVLWFREPRFLNQLVRVGGDFWLTMRNRDVYNEQGLREGSFTLNRKRIHLFTDKEFHRYFKFGLGTDLQWDEVSEDALSDERKSLNLQNGFNANLTQRNLLFQAYTQIGRINYDVFNVQGYQSLIEFDQSHKTWGSDETFSRILLTNMAFWLLPWNSNLGIQVRLGSSNTQSIQNVSFLGGFESVRGFPDGKFKAKHFWQSNLEYRMPSIQNRWLILQHVVFGDVVAPIGGQVTGSAGGGIRIISPKIYRLNLRLDAAYGFRFNEGLAISFGTQQFF